MPKVVLEMRVRVYKRIATEAVARVRNTVWRAIFPCCWLGGSIKLGSTPGGGSTIPEYSVDMILAVIFSDEIKQSLPDRIVGVVGVLRTRFALK